MPKARLFEKKEEWKRYTVLARDGHILTIKCPFCNFNSGRSELKFSCHCGMCGARFEDSGLAYRTRATQQLPRQQEG